MENEQVINVAVEKLRSSFTEAPSDMSLVKWLPYLELKDSHPLDPNRGDKLREAEEIYEFFKELEPEKPFQKFMAHVSTLAPLPHGETKVKQVLRSIRLLRLAIKTKHELEEMGISLK